MKNIQNWPGKALTLRLRMLRHSGVAEALSPFHPVGWCGGVQIPGMEAPSFIWGGEAVINGAPVSRDTIFRVASISKVFGAAACLRLVARGALSLDGAVSDILGFATAKPITLRQLLTHTAALDDSIIYDDVIGTPDAPTLDVVLNKSFLDYEPGTTFRYSNLGAGVAGMMVEAASGMLFDDFIRQEFFTPYGIDASFHPQRIVHKEHMANCYRVPGRKLQYDAAAIAASPLDEIPNPLMHYAVPAGKLMISAPNLLTAMQRLTQEDKALFVRQKGIGSVQGDAGRGLGVATVPKGIFARDKAFWGHQGTAYGAVCEAWVDLADDTAVVILTNGARLSSIGPLYRVGQSGCAALLDHAARSLVY